MQADMKVRIVLVLQDYSIVQYTTTFYRRFRLFFFNNFLELVLESDFDFFVTLKWPDTVDCLHDDVEAAAEAGASAWILVMRRAIRENSS